VAELMGDVGPWNADKETVIEIVEDLVGLANTDKVFAFHDDQLGLKSSFPNDLLNLRLADLDDTQYVSEIEVVISDAKIILELNETELTSVLKDDIAEDLAYRGAGS
jgi:hypothetical protein